MRPQAKNRLPLDKVRQIEQFLREGKTHRAISQILNVSVGVISKLRKKINFNIPKNRAGAKPKLTKRTKQFIIKNIRSGTVENAVKMRTVLLSKNLANVSAETIRRTLKEVGMKSYVKAKKPLLTERHRKLRLNFAKQYKNWSISQWAKVIWSDETKINRFGSDGRRWTWRNPGSILLPHNVNQTIKFGGGSIMVWGCMMAHGIGQIKKIEGRMTSASYIQILEENLLESVKNWQYNIGDVIFQQDNDPKHTAKITKKWLKDKGFVTLEWPPQSPDLNPIEHLWGDLKRALTDFSIRADTVDELWDRVQAKWAGISAETTRKLVESMPNRITAVLKAKGGYTKY